MTRSSGPPGFPSQLRHTVPPSDPTSDPRNRIGGRSPAGTKTARISLPEGALPVPGDRPPTTQEQIHGLSRPHRAPRHVDRGYLVTDRLRTMASPSRRAGPVAPLQLRQRPPYRRPIPRSHPRGGLHHLEAPRTFGRQGG